MNNKGFTLVELLATLVILALVMSIGTVSIIAIVNNAKAKNYDLLVKNIKDAAELYYQECRYSNNSGISCVTTGESYQISLGDLVTYGYLKGNSKDDNSAYSLVNPNDKETITACIIKVKNVNKKITVEDVTNSGSCPTQADYNK